MADDTAPNGDRREPGSPPDRRHRPFVVPASVVAIFFIGFGLTTLGFYLIQHRAQVRFDKQQTQIRSQQATLFDAQYGSCLRVNRLRHNDNRNAITEYNTLQIIVSLTRGPVPARAVEIKSVLDRLSKASPETVRALVELMRPVPGLDKRFRRLAKSIKYIPPTDCKHAVGTPEQFRAPTATPVYLLSDRQRRELQSTGAIAPQR